MLDVQENEGGGGDEEMSESLIELFDLGTHQFRCLVSLTFKDIMFTYLSEIVLAIARHEIKITDCG